MAKIIHLVRHGHHALVDRVLCGRMPGVELDGLGRRQIELAAGLISPPPSAIQSSPQPRARQSADIIAARFGLPVAIVPDMDEIDLGEFTSLAFADLEQDPRWRQWNTRRGSTSPPSGESMRALQARVVRHLEEVGGDASDDVVAIVSHAEPIRAALLHYLAIPLDDFHSVEVAPASISTLIRDGRSLRVANFNEEVPA